MWLYSARCDSATVLVVVGYLCIQLCMACICYECVKADCDMWQRGKQKSRVWLHHREHNWQSLSYHLERISWYLHSVVPTSFQTLMLWMKRAHAKSNIWCAFSGLMCLSPGLMFLRAPAKYLCFDLYPCLCLYWNIYIYIYIYIYTYIMYMRKCTMVSIVTVCVL